MPTALAPSASALKMSVPRRNPPSTSTGTRPRTPATTSTRLSIAGAAAVFRPPAVIRDDHAVHAVLDGEFCVLASHDALDDEFPRPDVAQPLQVIPVHVEPGDVR